MTAKAMPGITAPVGGRFRGAPLWLVPLVLAGAVLRLVQLLANRSLWIDEAALALNLIHKSAAQLTGHLEHGQMAPIGFLWLEKASMELFGDGETALRLVPFAASLVALVLFARIAQANLAGAGAAVAVAVFALNHRLIYYGSEVKQYAMDVAVAVVLLALGLAGGRPWTRRRLVILAIAGSVGGWVSEPACFVLAGLGASLLTAAARRRDRRLAVQAAGLGLWWLVTVVPVLLLERRNLSAADSAILVRYWSDGLAPRPLEPAGVARWLRAVSVRTLAYLFEPTALGPRVQQVTMLQLFVLLVAGLACLARRSPEKFVLLALPVALAVAGGVSTVYPLSRRLALYLVPMVLLAIGAGVEALRGAFGAAGGFAATAAGVTLVVTAAARTLAVIPESVEELRPVLAEVAAQRRAGDAIYVHNGAVRAYEYYAPRLGLVGLPTTLGCCHLNQWQLELEDIRRLGPRPRIWFVFAHPQDGESAFFPEALDRLGTRLASVRARDASAHLYEIGAIDEATIAGVLRAAPPERTKTELDWECLGGILVVAPCGEP